MALPTIPCLLTFYRSVFVATFCFVKVCLYVFHLRQGGINGSKGIGPVAVGSVTNYQTLIYKPIQVFLGLRCAEVDILCQLFRPCRLMFVQIDQNCRLFIVGCCRFVVGYRRFVVGYLLYPALVLLGPSNFSSTIIAVRSLPLRGMKTTSA